MKVTIDIQVLIEEIQKTNPNVDQTSLKATLLDLIVEGKASVPATEPVQLPREERLGPPILNRVTRPAPVIEQVVERAAPAARVHDDGMEPMHSPDDDPLAEIARQAMSAPLTKEPVQTAAAPGRVVVTNKNTSPQKQPLLDKQSKEAKRREMAEFSNMSSKEIMERLTTSQLPKKKTGQNQFTDQGGGSSAGDGDIEIG
jgi:hypothetical protein